VLEPEIALHGLDARPDPVLRHAGAARGLQDEGLGETDARDACLATRAGDGGYKRRKIAIRPDPALQRRRG
jgi:hypothetical protein